MMRKSNWTLYRVGRRRSEHLLILEDFGRLGRTWRETDVEATDLKTVIADLLSGPYNNPVRVIENPWRRRTFHPTWPHELCRRCDEQLPCRYVSRDRWLLAGCGI
jgi:hypothetical protein